MAKLDPEHLAAILKLGAMILVVIAESIHDTGMFDQKGMTNGKRKPATRAA